MNFQFHFSNKLTFIDGTGETLSTVVTSFVSSFFETETTLSTLSLELIDEDPDDAEDESLDLRNILMYKHSQNITKSFKSLSTCFHCLNQNHQLQD